ncbi:MAG: dienelactone hydrolase family protein [Armatimonadota bacterium]
MARTYQHLGVYSDWVDAARKAHRLYPVAPPGKETQQRVRETLGFRFSNERPRLVRVERRWVRDGIEGEEVSWSVGYGPRTYAWVLKPEGVGEPLPGVVALHDHGGFKYYGKEKIADGPEETPPVLVPFREQYYGGRAFANALAKEGFVVLVPDTFLWGSRRFPLEDIPPGDRNAGAATLSWWKNEHTPDEIALFNSVSAFHEHTVEKYCHLLGTTLAGVVSYEDRVAVNYLASRPDVRGDAIGCVGLSGGGCRSALLQATSDRIRAAVIVGMMSTFEHLLDHNVITHTWMFLPWGWARYGDWPDLAACRAPSPLMVQYDLDDGLFTQEGMRAAHQRIAEHYRSVGKPDHYVGEFYPGGHKFDLQMQASAFAWLRKRLG